MTLGPRHSKFCTIWAKYIFRNSDYPDARLALTRALKLKPDWADTLLLLAQTYTQQSKPVDALDLLIHAHKLAPDNVDILLLLARVSMSQTTTKIQSLCSNPV